MATAQLIATPATDWVLCRSLSCAFDLDWLFAWQTLITGLLAAAVAVYATLFIRRQLDRQGQAARVALPITLSALTEYAEEVTGAITAYIQALRAMAEGDAAPTLKPPPLPTEHAGALERAAGGTDDRVVIRRIAKLLGKLQLVNARMRMSEDERITAGAATAREMEHNLMEVGLLYAAADSLFEYARFEVKRIDRRLGWEDVYRGLGLLKLDRQTWPELFRHTDVHRDADGDPLD